MRPVAANISNSTSFKDKNYYRLANNKYIVQVQLDQLMEVATGQVEALIIMVVAQV